MNRRSTIAGAALISALAFPAVAAAHPSVYEATARALAPGDTAPIAPGELVDQTRYVVTNHGFTFLLREDNGVGAPFGVMNYARMPGEYRNQPGFTKAQLLTEGGTGAQAHATCRGVAALEAEDAILAWQEEDPFYNYVPFQKTSAGLEDDPAHWIPVVKERTGVDLATVADPAAACAGLGGTYAAADATQTTATALNSGLLAEAAKPLQAEIDSLKGQVGTLTAGKVAAELAATAAQREVTTLRAQVAASAYNLPLSVALVSKSVTARALRAGTPTVRVTGPARERVTVRMMLTKARARRLKLKSTTIATVTGTIGANGTVLLKLKSSAATHRRLRSTRGKLPVRVEATLARKATATGTLSR